MVRGLSPGGNRIRTIGPAEKETAIERPRGRSSSRETTMLNDTIQLIGPVSPFGNSRDTFRNSGTDGSNPVRSTGESAANLAPSIRCRWPPLPSHFSLLSPLAPPAPASAEAPIQAATMVTHYRKATIDGVSIFYREAGPADGPVFLLLHGFPTSSPTA
jgi:hypothetical protein